MHVGDFIQTFYEDHVAIVEALKTHKLKNVQAQLQRHTNNIMKIIRSGELTYIRPGGKDNPDVESGNILK